MSARYSKQQGYVISKRAPNRMTVRSVKRRVRFGPTVAKYIGLGTLAVLAIFMIAQSSTGSTGAYKQNALNKQISQVNQDIQQLQLEAERAQSLQAISNTPVQAQMTPIKNVTYVGGEVAGVSTSRPATGSSSPSPSPTPVPANSSPTASTPTSPASPTVVSP